MTTTTLTKTARTVVASQSAAVGTPVRGTLDLRTAQGGILFAKITNGSSGPTEPCALIISAAVSDGATPASGAVGATWKRVMTFAGTTTANDVTDWALDIPPVQHLQVEFSGNTGQAVTVEAFFSEITSAFEAQISALFASGEQGAWYDPSDLSTLYQDSAGTTPVTALGQPVGRMLDKSGRGNHASQPTATARPTLQADASGRKYLQFDGVDDFMSIGGNTDWMLGSGSVTMAMAVQRSGVTTAIGHYMLSASKAGDSTWNKNLIGLSLYENSNRVTFTSLDAASVMRYATGAYDSLLVGPAYVVMGTRNATHLNAYTDGVLGTGDTLAGSDPISGTSQARLWAREDWGVANIAQINGNCFGVICIAAELDSTRRGQVERYLASKAGVTL